MNSVDRDDISSAFFVRGSGPPLLMIHGADADHRMFAALTERLAPHFTCIGYDQRDSGRTVSEAPSQYTIDDLADDAAAVIHAAGFERAHVYGTSFGGQVAQNLAVRHGRLVDRLVLGNTWRSGLRLVDINPEVAQTLDALRANRAANAAQIAAYFHPREYLEAHTAVIAGFGTTARDAAQQGRRKTLMTQVAAVELARIAAPTLVIAGQFDRLVRPAITLALLEHIPGSVGTVLQDAGHVPCVHRPDALARTIRRFLVTQLD
jgi:pimeloyl-ACP methyl ester carboxylesterase